MASRTGTQFLGLALVTLAGPAAAACVSIGTAYSADGERVVYREQRTEQRRGGELVACEVDYLTPKGELFAEKTIRFDGRSTAPAFTFVDYREEFREGGGPLSFWAGERVGAIEFASLGAYLILACVWAAVMPALIWLSDRLAPRRAGYR